MKKVVGIFEAKTHFTQIITQVMSGEEIFITRRGEKVAKIVPIEKNVNSEMMKLTINRLHDLTKEMKLGKFNWDDFKKYRDEGRL
jgi:prevent-host-death family protein